MKAIFEIKNIFKKIRWLFLILFITGFLNYLYSAKIHPDAGTTSSTFLKIPVGSRASSMGGGYVSCLDDMFSSFYNPAGTVTLEKRKFAFMHNIHFEDIKQYAFVYGFEPNFEKYKKDYLSFSFNYITYSSIDKRSGLYESDPINPSIIEGNFKSKDFAIMANYSFLKSTSVLLGANIKYINQSIDNETGFAFALDMGGIKKFKIKDKDFNIGASVLNIGTKLKIISAPYPLPMAFKAGVSTEYKKSFLSFDILKYRDNYPFLIIGFENKIAKELYLRLGYRYRIYGNELGFWSGLSSGFGFNYNNILFGYSLNSYGELGYSHKIELIIKYK